VTDKPDSPHLLAPKIKARMYFGIASSDDEKQPDAKVKLKAAFAAALVQTEIEVYPAQHGWCIPDMPSAMALRSITSRSRARLGQTRRPVSSQTHVETATLVRPAGKALQRASPHLHFAGRYCSSLTCSIQSTTLPSFFS